jgi:uncharacterized protein (TIGR02996 family)
MPTSEELAFIERIREQPDDDGPRLIFADWLDERGDPRGEFIRVQCALARLPDGDARRSNLELAEHQLLESHQAAWTAPLAGLASDWTYRRGFIDSLSVTAVAFLERGGEIFRLGPVRRIRFVDSGHCFVKLVESPFLGKVREIDLCGSFLGNNGVSLLSRAKQLSRLELLHLGFNDLSDPALKALADMPHLANLSELYLDDNRQIGPPGLRAIADSPYLGNLRRLDLGGNNLTETALKVLINGDALKKLDALTLAGNQIGDGGAESLARSELLDRMIARNSVLDLSRNNIGPLGARALAESPRLEPLFALKLDINVLGDQGLTSLAQSPYLRNLRRLELQENRITDVGVMALARSRLVETLDFIDLTGNFITTESVQTLREAGIAYNWRREISIRHDPGLHLRLPGPALGPPVR